MSSATYSKTVSQIWERGPEGTLGFISSLDRDTGMWVDVPVPNDERATYYQEENTDVFFSPLTFTKARRLNRTAATPITLLFADLDPVDPSRLDLTPHVAWETSPGNYQGVWLVHGGFKYVTAWAKMNRRLTYTLGADKGGWHASKVLRIPGTVNYKRGGVVGKLLWSELDGPPYALELLDEILLPVETVAQEAGEAPVISRDPEKLDAMWETLPPRIQHRIARGNPKDRSLEIVRVAHLMREEGVLKETAFHMLWYAPWCKWRHRNNPDRLWTEVSHVYDG